MPEYLYRCKKCKKKFNDTKNMDKIYETNCPYCGQEQTGKENLEVVPQLTNFIIS